MARKPGYLPVPMSLMVSGVTDLPVAKQIMQDHASARSGRLYADKAYADADWAHSLKQNCALALLTPWKKKKGDALVSGDVFSTFVSSVRQPVECFFNWLNHLTNIQSASAVRSLLRLIFYVIGRIAAAPGLHFLLRSYSTMDLISCDTNQLRERFHNLILNLN